ncbi:MAG: tetratricopeptide repeat protein [Planctomycetota bacterium]
MRLPMFFRCIPLFALGFLCSASVARSADGLAAALEQWHRGDSTAALRQLTNLIENDSEDPRVHMARGLLLDQRGQPADDDFRRAAALEATTGNSSALNALLEPVGGSLRQKIERFRFEARAALKPDPATENLKGVFREALELRRSGNRDAALEKFQQLTASGNDPRYFYMHGVVLAEAGDQTAAAAMFSQALTRETSLRQMQLVNDLLSSISPQTRLLIEEQAKVDVGGEIITRRLLRDELRRRALMSEEQLLAETNAAAAAADREASAALENRRRSAVEQILAERAREAAKNQQMAEALSGQNTTPAEPAVAAADVPKAPSAPTSPANPAAPPKNTANPFLGGAGVPRTRPADNGSPPAKAPAAAASTGLNASWLPANSELILSLRPADIGASPAVQAAGGIAAADAAIPQLQSLGLSIGDVDTLTLAISDVVLAFGPIATQAAAGGTPDPAVLQKQLSDKAIAVLRLSKDIDTAALATALQATSASENGTTWYKVPAPQPDQPESAWFAPDARTIVMGPEKTIKAAIANGAGENSLENFAFVPGDSHMVIAFSSPLLAGLSAAITAPQGAPPSIGTLADAVKGKVSGAAISLNYDNSVAFSVLLNLIDEDAAGEAGQALQETVGLAKQMVPLLAAQLPQPLVPGIQEMVNSLEGSSRATVLSLAATVPQSLIEAVQQNPGLFAPAGLPGAPGLPGLAPPQ